MKKCREELAKLVDENGKLETNETSAKNIQSDVIMIDSYINDIVRYEKDESRLVTKISESGSIRNLHEAITEQKSLKNTISGICNILEKKQYELNDYNETLHELQTQHNRITTNELNIKSNMQDQKSLLDKLNDLQTLETTLSFELDNARETIEPIQENLRMCISNFEETKKQQIKKIENIRKEVFSLIILF